MELELNEEKLNINMEKAIMLEKIVGLLRCLDCSGDLKLEESDFVCQNCGKKFPIVDGVPRFVPEKFWKLDNSNDSIQEKTKNYFGYEWDYFEDWGFIKDEDITPRERRLFRAGTINSRKETFDAKCRMTDEDLSENKIVLDAGCGNGRYTYEAAIRSKALVIGVDIGFGSVKSAYKNCKDLDNVIIIQASLFDLPFREGIIDYCFSNGVLMHTGNARKAFGCLSKVIKKDGIFVAHIYNKLNPVWEFNDFIIRSITTRLSISVNMHFANFLANIGKITGRDSKIHELVNLFIRIQGHPILMFDWYAAPVATHHTYNELAGWYKENGFEILDNIPKRGLIKQPWGINLKGKKTYSL